MLDKTVIEQDRLYYTDHTECPNGKLTIKLYQLNEYKNRTQTQINQIEETQSITIEHDQNTEDPIASWGRERWLDSDNWESTVKLQTRK